MNLRKAIFVFGGCTLIFVILAYRFGLFKKLIASEKEKEPAVQVAKKSTPKATPKKQVETKKTTPKVEVPKVETSKTVEPKASVKETETPKETVKTEAKEKLEEKVINSKKPVEPVVLNEFGEGNPFSYSSAGDGSYSPSLNNQQVGQLVVKGIIAIEGAEPMAILHMNNSNNVYYVKKGDVIRVNVKSRTAALITETYIVVKDVRHDEVELIQQERPDKVIIVR